MDADIESRFGRSRFGGSTGALTALSLGGGMLLSVLFAAAMTWQQRPERPEIAQSFTLPSCCQS
ncbi:MAG TPA: hypothetical protein VIG67_00870 [Yaniella sp.]